jgi:hypothetical protein
MFPGGEESHHFLKVEDYVFLAGDRIEPILSQTVDPLIRELDTNRNNALTAVCLNLISAYDSARCDQESTLLVANRTFRVGQFIALLSGAPEPRLTVSSLLAGGPAKDAVFEHVAAISEKELATSPTFKELLYGCRPSIDPIGNEGDILDLFGGFVLLSMNLGHRDAAEKSSMENVGSQMAAASDEDWNDELEKLLNDQE